MFSLILSSAIAAAVPPPLVPGGCTAPAAEHMHENGCYLLAEMSAAKLPSLVYWQIIQFPTRLEAQTEARRHRWSEVVSAHDRIWLLVIGPANERVDGGVRKAIAGPMAVSPLFDIDFPSGNAHPRPLSSGLRSIFRGRG